MSMVDVSAKPEVYREAKAKGTIKLKSETIRLIREGKVEKGDPFEVAKVAGILAAKNTGSLIPLCHPLPLTSVEVKLQIIRLVIGNNIGPIYRNTVATIDISLIPPFPC